MQATNRMIQTLARVQIFTTFGSHHHRLFTRLPLEHAISPTGKGGSYPRNKDFTPNLMTNSSATEALREVILARRSVFTAQFSGEEVPREAVEQMLEAAHWAPNHGRTEPWWFRVYTGAGRLAFAKAHAELYRASVPETEFNQGKYDKILGHASEASVVIAICMKRGEKPNIPAMEEVEAVAAAVQNMWLTATSLGLGGYWSTGGMTYHPAMHNFLGLGPEDQCLGFFMLGVPAATPPAGRRNQPWQAKVEWIEQ